MDVAKILADAQKAVKEANLDPDLKTVAFEKAIDLLTDGPPPKSTLEVKTPDSTSGVSAPRAQTESGRLDQIAAKLNVSAELVNEVYIEDEGKLALTIPSKRLDAKKSGGARQLALLVAAGRQAGGYDEGWTQTEEIRTVCKDYDKFDEGNFAKALSAMDDVFQIKGKGASREVRMKNPGYEAAGELIAQLTKRDS